MPVFPTVTAHVTFRKFDRKPVIPANTFQIPHDYTHDTRRTPDIEFLDEDYEEDGQHEDELASEDVPLALADVSATQSASEQEQGSRDDNDEDNDDEFVDATDA
jgi:hypothetical protein